MNWPSLGTYDRINRDHQREQRTKGYEQSYFGMRLVIGFIGLALPLALVAVDGWLIDTPLSVRGSMSAYYHSPARDLFVGGLSACGLTLITYMFWKWWTWDFLISFVGGFAVLGVAAFPTARPRGADDTAEVPSCTYKSDGAPPCTALQQVWGEGDVRAIHLVVTAVAVASFAALCAVFALRDFGYGKAAHELVGGDSNALGPRRIWNRLTEGGGDLTGVVQHVRRRAPRTALYLLCLAGVILGAAWAVVGRDWLVPHSYAGEFIAFTAFGSAWIVASWDLLNDANWLKRVLTGVGRTMGVEA